MVRKSEGGMRLVVGGRLKQWWCSKGGGEGAWLQPFTRQWARREHAVIMCRPTLRNQGLACGFLRTNCRECPCAVCGVRVPCCVVAIACCARFSRCTRDSRRSLSHLSHIHPLTASQSPIGHKTSELRFTRQPGRGQARECDQTGGTWHIRVAPCSHAALPVPSASPLSQVAVEDRLPAHRFACRLRVSSTFPLARSRRGGTMSTLQRPASGATRPGPVALIGLAWALRVLIALLPGYVHPDEVFQSAEVVGAVVLGTYANVPWEFAACDSPNRSILPPMLSTGVPYAVLRWLGVRSGWLLLLLPRWWLACLAALTGERVSGVARVLRTIVCTHWTSQCHPCCHLCPPRHRPPSPVSLRGLVQSGRWLTRCSDWGWVLWWD